jgi:membrane protein
MHRPRHDARCGTADEPTAPAGTVPALHGPVVPSSLRSTLRAVSLSPRQWLSVLKALQARVRDDHVPILSAGLAFYAMLAMFPGLLALVTIYALFLDPVTLEDQIAPVTELLPESAAALVRAQLRDIVGTASRTLGIGLLLGLGGVLWSTAAGMNALFEGVQLAYFAHESRSFLRLRGLALLATLAMLGFAVVALASLAIVPPLLAGLGAPDGVLRLVTWLRWPLLVTMLVVGLAVLYRVAPDREGPATFRWVSPGSIVATALWLLGSVGLSTYVSRFGAFNETYGAIGAAIVLLLWLWVSAFSVLLGAELNAELERRLGTLGPRHARRDGRRPAHPPAPGRPAAAPPS